MIVTDCFSLRRRYSGSSKTIGDNFFGSIRVMHEGDPTMRRQSNGTIIM